MPKVPRGGYLKKVLLIIGLTKELCIGAYQFSRSVIRIGRKSGWLHCALYLKQCASSLQNGSVKLFLSFQLESLPLLIKSLLKPDQGMEKSLDE